MPQCVQLGHGGVFADQANRKRAACPPEHSN
jgi:hypothetical protein